MLQHLGQRAHVQALATATGDEMVGLSALADGPTRRRPRISHGAAYPVRR